MFHDDLSVVSSKSFASFILDARYGDPPVNMKTVNSKIFLLLYKKPPKECTQTIERGLLHKDYKI